MIICPTTIAQNSFVSEFLACEQVHVWGEGAFVHEIERLRLSCLECVIRSIRSSKEVGCGSLSSAFLCPIIVCSRSRFDSYFTVISKKEMSTKFRFLTDSVLIALSAFSCYMVHPLFFGTFSRATGARTVLQLSTRLMLGARRRRLKSCKQSFRDCSSRSFRVVFTLRSRCEVLNQLQILRRDASCVIIT